MGLACRAGHASHVKCFMCHGASLQLRYVIHVILFIHLYPLGVSSTRGQPLSQLPVQRSPRHAAMVFTCGDLVFAPRGRLAPYTCLRRTCSIAAYGATASTHPAIRPIDTTSATDAPMRRCPFGALPASSMRPFLRRIAFRVVHTPPGMLQFPFDVYNPFLLRPGGHDQDQHRDQHHCRPL